MANLVSYFRSKNIRLTKLFHTAWHHPDAVARYFRYPKPVSSADCVVSLGLCSEKEAAGYVDEYRNGNVEFWKEFREHYFSVRGRYPKLGYYIEGLYVLVRARKPNMMIETGPFDGQSTALILQAMNLNQKGKLVSIDLPATYSQDLATAEMNETTLPKGQPSAWAVPERLRARVHMAIGDAKYKLPEVCRENAPIDMFFHDSLHSFGHMFFEYTEANAYMTPGGIICSDDALWNDAFADFCREVGYQHYQVGGLGVTMKTAKP